VPVVAMDLAASGLSWAGSDGAAAGRVLGRVLGLVLVLVVMVFLGSRGGDGGSDGSGGSGSGFRRNGRCLGRTGGLAVPMNRELGDTDINICT
jgi:hypothetical protein